MKSIIAILLFVFAAHAQLAHQKLRVVSEFTRIDPFGNIVPMDRGKLESRHILSPGFARNGWASLRVIVNLEDRGQFILDVGQNPEDAIKVTMYREVFEKHDDTWIPDRLEKIALPYDSSYDNTLPSQKVITFWMDMWIDAKLDVDRYKVEPQLHVKGDWITYPMEVRILDAVIPAMKYVPVRVPDAALPSDSPAREVLCSSKPAPLSLTPEPVTTRQLIRRNAMQLSIFAKPHRAGPPTPGLEKFCPTAASNPFGPEWVLRYRDALYRTADR